MPLYEYLCDACGQRFEVIQKYSEVSETCRLCGKGPVHRQASAPGIQFKGSGFYITDYAQKGRSGGESSSAGKSSSTEKSDTKTSDSGSSESSTKTESSPAPAAPPPPATKT
jgi:putative FmdB family regulatory protein